MAALVAEARGERSHEQGREVTDAYLLKAFPGRTLEELDGMDWGRWRRAEEAQLHMDVEHIRATAFENKRTFSELPEAVLRLIQEHDALLGDDDGAE